MSLPAPLTAPRAAPRRGRIVTESAIIGLVVGVLVVLPWTTGGYLMLLDWVSGPSQTLSPGVYGLSGSALDAMPFRIATQLLRATIGPAVTAWVVILLFFPIVAGGIAAAAGRSRWRAHVATLVMVCNPWVVDRVRAGHVALLLGVAMLPWLFTAARDARERGKWFAVRPALWFALAMAASPHTAWLGGLMLLAGLVTPKPTARDVVRTAQIVLTAALVYSYALVLWFTGTRTLRVTEVDLSAYQTRPGPGGLAVTVLSLHGFWRGGSGQVRDVVGPVVGVVVLVVVVVAVSVGLGRLWRIEPTRGRPLVVMTVAGLLLGAGVLGPAGGLYRLAFAHLPLFEAMREQEKWLALVVIGYAVGLGAAVEWLAAAARLRLASAQPARGRPMAVGAVVLAAVPLTAAPALLWGLGGSISTSSYPDGWQQADSLMGSGQGAVLFLPWHGYQPFAFTDGRTVATPAAAFFRHEVLASDAVELPQLRTDSTSLRSEYLDRVIASAGEDAFGRLVAPLGVEYIALATDRESRGYAWVGRQPGVVKVLSTDTMDLYRVIPQGTGRVVAARTLDYEQTVRSARQGRLGTEAVLRPPGDGRTDGPRSSSSGGLVRSSPTSWTVAAGVPGWVVVAEEWSDGWQIDGRGGVPTVAGTVALTTDGSSQSITYAPWRLLAPALVVSIAVLLALIVGGVIEHRRQARALVSRRPIPSSRPPDDRDRSDG